MFDYCPGCGEIVAAGEPCECVFTARGWVDAQGVLHTAKRVPIDTLHAPSGTKPSKSMLITAATERIDATVAWIEDHGHQGWQILEPR